jgi:molybdopterin-guanine dinucleotide biosynthesis protein MobB
MKPLIVGIVGSRNTGKSTFTLKLSNFIVTIGMKVAIIKYSQSHYTIEPESKDSALFHKSKAENVIFSSPYETVSYLKNFQEIPTPLDELLQLVPDEIDIVLCESYPSKFGAIPCIFIVKDKSDFVETKARYSEQRPLFISGPYTETHQGDLEGIPLLSFDRSEDLIIISKVFEELKSSENEVGNH